MKPRKRSLPASFLKEWRFIPPSQWGLRSTFEAFFNAGREETEKVQSSLDETKNVLRDLYENARYHMSPAQIERVLSVLGEEDTSAGDNPGFCAICTRPRKDLFPERVNDKMSWVCTDCTDLSARDPRYRFDETPPDPSMPTGALGRSNK